MAVCTNAFLYEKEKRITTDKGGQAVSDTPRTDARLIEGIMLDGRVEQLDRVYATFARTIERELNAANERIKRLEEAGDALCAAAAFMGWHMEIEKWNKSKEAKP